MVIVYCDTASYIFSNVSGGLYINGVHINTTRVDKDFNDDEMEHYKILTEEDGITKVQARFLTNLYFSAPYIDESDCGVMGLLDEIAWRVYNRLPVPDVVSMLRVV